MISYGYEREQDRLRQVRAAHLPEVLQRRRDLLQLRPTASQAAEPRSQRQGYGHHGQRLHLRCREQRASMVNGASVLQSDKVGGQMAHTYTYDNL